jgi:hypothetical protein
MTFIRIIIIYKTTFIRLLLYIQLVSFITAVIHHSYNISYTSFVHSTSPYQPQFYLLGVLQLVTESPPQSPVACKLSPFVPYCSR